MLLFILFSMGFGFDLVNAGLQMGQSKATRQYFIVYGLFTAQPTDILYVSHTSGNANYYRISNGRTDAHSTRHDFDDIFGQYAVFVYVCVRYIGDV